MLSSKDRAYLRALANPMDPVFQIGKGGISEEMCLQLGRCLEARELIKVRVLNNSGYTAKEAAKTVAEQLGADVVSVVGTKFVLYRQSEKEQKIFLP